MDASLAALIATYPSAEEGGPDLGAPIRESRELVRAAIGLLSGFLLSSEAPDLVPGTAKRRVKIKAESASTASGGRARAETAVRSEPGAPQEPAKRAARGGDSARSVSASASASAAAMASTQEPPPNSLLARLGAATPEPAARHPDAADGTGDPTPAPAPQASHVSARAAAERLERLEAEIDSLTEATTTGGHRSRSATTDAPGVPASMTAQSQPPSHAAAAASASEYRQGVDGAAAADDEDDAEIVIITSQTGGRPARQGTPPVRQSPRIFSDQSSSDDDDAEVEIVQPGTRPSVSGRAARTPATPEGEHAKPGASAPVAPAKWRLFRGSR
jgi:hypothetical protein